jgi:DNA-binding PadR family transcriptional regulator
VYRQATESLANLGTFDCSANFFYVFEEIGARHPMELTTLEQHVLLAIMALQPNAYGISVQDHISRKVGHERSVGSIYAALDRLEEKGFVRSHPGEATPERGGKRKLYFGLTAPGQKALSESLRAVRSLSRAARWQEATA